MFMFISNTFPGDTGLVMPEYKCLHFEMGPLDLLSLKQSVSMTKELFHFFLSKVIIIFFSQSVCSVTKSFGRR